jgi:voltage-gated potassium channel
VSGSGRSAGRRWGRRVVPTAALVGCYYLVPLFDTSSTGRVWLRTVAAALLLVGALWLVVATVAHEARADDADIRVDHVLVAAVAGVICFALIDYVIAHHDGTQFAGLRTKTDALYFAVTTLATVGFGDVHAQGQLARQVVTVQMVFNLVVLASAARVLLRGVSRRARANHRAGSHSAGVVPESVVPESVVPESVVPESVVSESVVSEGVVPVDGEAPDHPDIQPDDHQ